VGTRQNYQNRVMDDIVRRELESDPTIDITTTGRRSGQPRRIEIWMLAVGQRFFITGTPGKRDWLANLRANPELVVHLKRDAGLDLPARAVGVTDVPTRQLVVDSLVASWYRGQTPVDDLLVHAPMVEVTFET
jgi:deazaflavin-dependent oxidoreductase (nitroreductase family)